MWLAPLGAFGGMAYTVAVFGADSLTSLGALMAVFWGTCAFLVIVVLGTVARLSGFSIVRLVRLIRDEPDEDERTGRFERDSELVAPTR